MAIWETSAVVNGAVWLGGTFDSNTRQFVVKIDDGNATDMILKAGELVTVTNSQGATESGWTFQGILTVNGVGYPVLSKSGDWIAVGLSQDTANIPSTISTASLDTGDFTVCFFPGTLIATPSGELKVEDLASGDLVSVGESCVVPIKWIGRQTVSTIFGPADRLMPVRFSAGSLGGGGGLYAA